MQAKRHFVALDGLRGIAALTVVALHLLESVPVANGPPQGQLAVDFFFMLSGFVVAHAYEEKLRTTMSFSRFSLIRIFRLYPMIFLGVTLGVISRLVDGAAGHHLADVLGAAAFAFLLLPLPRHSAVPVSAFPLNGPLWSLTYELISNLAYAAFVRWLNTRILLVLAAVFSVALCAVLVKEHGVQASVAWGPSLFYGLARVFAPFTIGVLLLRLGGASRPRSSGLSVLTAVVLIAILWAPVRDNAAYDLVAILVVFPAIILMAARSPDQGPMSRLWVMLGALSYPVYAINQPFFRLCAVVVARARIPGAMLPWFAGASFVGCLLAAYVITLVYDEPVRRFLSRRWLKRDVPPVIGSTDTPDSGVVLVRPNEAA